MLGSTSSAYCNDHFKQTFQIVVEIRPAHKTAFLRFYRHVFDLLNFEWGVFLLYPPQKTCNFFDEH